MFEIILKGSAVMESNTLEFLKYSDVLGASNTTKFIIAVIIILIGYYLTGTRGLPPGPIGLPLLGYAPFLKDATLHLVLDKLQKKYGDLFCFNYTGQLYINMGSMKAMREIHINKADCFERTSDFNFFTYVFGDGVGFINGEPWKVLRKFCLQQFRESGITTIKNSMSDPLYDSIKETIDYLKEKKGEPVEIIQHITDKCNIILRRTLFGDTGVTEQQVKELNDSYGQVMMFMTVTNILYTGKAAKYLFLPLKPGYRNTVQHFKNMERILKEVVDEHKSSFKNKRFIQEENPPNFIDAFLNERSKRSSKGDPTAEYFSDKSLISTLIQFVGDGVLSVAAYVALFLKKVVDEDECQEKIYQEIVEVVGHARAPTIEDKGNMHYTNAFILEVIRCSDFFSAFPSQQCIKETTVRGYRIPKGAITLMNMYSFHHDPNTFVDPEKFDPTRFLTGRQRSELPNNFGIGKRACIGEGFAMAQVFLFLATIIQNFKLSIRIEDDLTTFELFMSGKFKICANPRN